MINTHTQNRFTALFQVSRQLWWCLGAILLPLSQFYAQDNKIDSLSQVLKIHSQADTTRVMLLNDLAMAQWNVDPDQTERLGQSALDLAKKLDFQQGVAAAYNVLGVSYWMKGVYEKASEAAFESLRIYQKRNDAAGIAKVNTLLGLIYDEYGQYDKSINYHQKALQQQEAVGNQAGIATAANNLGAVYYKIDEYNKALEYFSRALEIRRTINDERGMAESLSNIGGVYRGQSAYDQALPYIQQAIEIRQRINDPIGIIPSLQQLAGIYKGKKQYDLAEKTYVEALDISNKLGIPKRQAEIYKSLSALNEEQGNYQQALEYYELYVVKRDSLQDQEAAAHLAELDTKYETERKEQQIEWLERENRTKTLIRNILAITVLILIALAIALYQFFSYRSRKKQELLETQQAMAQQLQEIDQMKSRFFANISHEFRTPLTLILEPLDDLVEQTRDPQAQGRLRMVQRNAHRLLQLINQLLELSKIEAGKLELRAAPANIVPYLRGIVMAFHSLAERRGIELSFSAPSDDLLLFFDRDKVEHVFNNLISNALKFTSKGGFVKVTLEQTIFQDKPYLQVDVQDTGVGIDASYLPYVFDRFYQVDHSDTKAFEGTGIGLALAKELVELHHGKILVQSEKGRGTTFSVLLPMGKAHLREEQILRISSTMAAPKMSMNPEIMDAAAPVMEANEAADQATILIVEDNADLQLFISQTLSGTYKVETANDGQLGLERALELVPDLIISDVMMPRMDGLTLCKHLKADERTSHIPVILLTAKNDAADKLQGLESLADDYLVKPFNTRELLARIKNLILSRKNLQEKFTGNIILKPKEVEVPSVEKVFFEKLMQIIEENIDNEHFSIEELSQEMAMSRSQLHRKLVALTNQTPSQFVRSYRLQRALQLLQQNAGTIADIAFQVGFSNPAYFTKVFSEEFGYAPRDWRQQNAD